MLEDLITSVENLQFSVDESHRKGRAPAIVHDLEKHLNKAKKDLADYVLAHARELISAERQAMTTNFLDDPS